MKAVFTFLLLISLKTITAQTIISGSVTDDKGVPLPGVNVSVKNTYDGGSTDLNGKFTFSTAEQGEQVIMATFVGYKSSEQPVHLSGKAITVAVQLKEEINQLEAVTISAGSFTAGDERRRTVLKAVDIATTAGATADIAGALNTLPGTQKVGESGRLFVRGGDSNETRTFIDGMAVLDAYSPSAPATPSRGRFLPFMFKGTSFSTGGYSAEFGQALSSALVLNSKDKAEMNQTDIGILSVGTDAAHTQVWDKASVTGKITYTNIRPYYGIINQRVDWAVPVVSMEGVASYRQQVGKDGMFKFYGNFSHTSFSLYNHDIADPSVRTLFDLRNDYRYGNATYKQSLNTKWSVRGGMSYNYNATNVKSDGNPTGESENGVHSKLVFENSASDRTELRFGAEVISRDYTGYITHSAIRYAQSFKETISAGFAEAEVFASPKLVGRGGLRTEYNNLNNQFGADPRVSLAWRPASSGQFSFAWGRFRQSAKNMYLRENTQLKSEMAEHVILNYQRINDNRTFRVETYYKRYSNLVKFAYAGQDTLFVNAGTGYAKGLELFWRDSKTVSNLDYWISYSLLDTKRNYLNFPASSIPSFASRHNFSVVGKYFFNPVRTQLGVTYSWSSSRRYYNPNVAEFNSSKTPNYSDLSANVSYLPKNWIILYVSCTNLLNRNNVFGYQYSTTPDASGVYAGRAVRQAAKQFLFFGVFITISKNKATNQLPVL